jgi:mono/diheme cytochrome c family protein
MKAILYAFALIAISVALAAAVGDPVNGRRQAESRCANCHIIAPNARREVADSPPFMAIAQKFRSEPDMLLFVLLEPHPRMNLQPPLTRREADDIAAYINSLAK